jgi:hypothetical protein
LTNRMKALLCGFKHKVEPFIMLADGRAKFFLDAVCENCVHKMNRLQITLYITSNACYNINVNKNKSTSPKKLEGVNEMFDTLLDYENSEMVGDLDGFIEKYCYPTDEEGKFEGFTLFQSDEVAMDIPFLFEEKTEFAIGKHLRIWVSEAELAEIVFVEGDIFVTIYKDEKEFRKAMEKAEETYRD